VALALITGIGLGLAVAMQVGPISLLCIRSVLRGSWAAGIGIAGGAALIDALYAALGTAGAASLLQIGPLQLALGLVGAAVLATIGLRTLWTAFRVRHGGEHPDEVRGARRAFAISLAATASNPLTIVSWAAVFSAASTARVADTPATASVMLLGVALGTFTWFSGLSTVLALIRKRVGTGFVRVVDAAAGAGLVGFGALLGVRAAHDA
jgi:threonine/homoserine/homoserine lactone efflux protein